MPEARGEISPAIYRWVAGVKRSESRRDEWTINRPAGTFEKRPTIIPALKHWATFARPFGTQVAMPTRLAPVRTCTQCGSRRVGRVGTDLRLRDGTIVTVEVDACSSCGERYLDAEAIEMIRLARPRKRPGR